MKKDSAYLQDILDASNSIESFLKGQTKLGFLKSDLLQSAVIRKFEIIGEAVKNLTKEMKGKHKDVPWKTVAGMRNLLVHEYFSVDAERVWGTAKKSLPPFKRQIREILTQIECDNADT